MSQLIEIEILGDDGAEPEYVKLDIGFDSLTMLESVRIEEALGPEEFDKLAAGGMVAARPTVIRAVIYAKLKTIRPALTLDGFDLDLAQLADLVPGPKDLGPE